MKTNIYINIPEEVKYILNKLNDNGYDAYIVGGCVRDSLLNKIPSDWDITTNATPIQIKKIFDKTIDTGIKHGTVTVVLNNKNFEITVYRVDGVYSDGRHPDSVTYTNSLIEDLSRRDFTINSMVYNEKDGLVDYFNGQRDLQEQFINTVGSANERFNDDALRMMRAVRFACQLNFSISLRTFLGIVRGKESIRLISQERIRDELCKILISDNPGRGINLLKSTGLLDIILPEISKMINFDQKNPAHHKDIYEHTLLVLDNTPNDLILRLSALLHDVGKPNTFSIDEKNIGHFYHHHVEGEIIAKQILRRLKFDNYTINTVCKLVREHMSRYDFLRVSSIKKFINRVGVDNLDRLFELQIADIKGSKAPYDFSGIENLRKNVYEVLNTKQPLTIKDLQINGYDLMEVGIEPGIEIGKILNWLLESVLENPELNEKGELLRLVVEGREDINETR